MACKRNRIIELKNFLNSLGIDTNISKTNARGHNGVFIHKTDGFRIDISKKLDEEKVIPVILHEFAHYIHYLYDEKLKSLDFIFGDFTEEIREELINTTVHSVPKDFAKSLYDKKEEINSDIKSLAKNIKNTYKDFKLSKNCIEIEKNFSNPLKYLLKYDRIKYFNKIYSVSNINSDFNLTETQLDYIKLKSKQRFLKRINAKINRLNKYYNNPFELFARFIELYYTDFEKAKKLAPLCCAKMQNTKINEFDKLNQIFKD